MRPDYTDPEVLLLHNFKAIRYQLSINAFPRLLWYIARYLENAGKPQNYDHSRRHENYNSRLRPKCHGAEVNRI